MFRIRRFGVVRTASVVAVMYFVLFALVLVPLLAIAGSVPQSAGPGQDAVRTFGPLGFAAVGLLVALLYAIVGWIFVALACLLYNVVARFTGGIEVQVERFEPPTVAPAWGSTPRDGGAVSGPSVTPGAGGGTGAGGS
jgi:hypothetical protein